MGLGISILGGRLETASFDNMGGDLEAEKELYLRRRLRPESGAGPARVSSHNFWRKLIVELIRSRRRWWWWWVVLNNEHHGLKSL